MSLTSGDAISSKIMLYSGPGAGPFCVQALENQLKDIADDRYHAISSCKNLLSLGNPQEVKAIVVPGGHAMDIYANSGVLGCEEEFKGILDQHKISYYGACAGAILASSGLHFGVPGSDRGFLSRETKFLGLFPGKTMGPLFQKSLGKEISLSDFNRRKIKSSHPGLDQPMVSAHILGPAFLNATSFFGTEVLSTYEELPSFTLGPIVNNVYTASRRVLTSELSESICHKRPGGASILLTGSHPEFDSAIARSEGFRQGFNITKEQQQDVVATMEVDDASRKILLKRNFEKIGIRCK